MPTFRSMKQREYKMAKESGKLMRLYSLRAGDWFRFSPDGPAWRVVELPDGRYRYRELGTDQERDYDTSENVYPILDPRT